MMLALALMCMTANAPADFDANKMINVISREEGSGTRSAFVELTGVEQKIDGIAVIVNHENPVSNLTVEQIGAIYTGDVMSWNEI